MFFLFKKIPNDEANEQTLTKRQKYKIAPAMMSTPGIMVFAQQIYIKSYEKLIFTEYSPFHSAVMQVYTHQIYMHMNYLYLFDISK